MKKSYVLKNKRRFTTFIITVLLLILAVFYTNTVYGYEEPTYKVITVKQGDTLWDIAIKYNNNDNIRKYIYEIKKLNNLSNVEIYEGSLLKLPSV